MDESAPVSGEPTVASWHQLDAWRRQIERTISDISGLPSQHKARSQTQRRPGRFSRQTTRGTFRAWRCICVSCRTVRSLGRHTTDLPHQFRNQLLECGDGRVVGARQRVGHRRDLEALRHTQPPHARGRDQEQLGRVSTWRGQRPLRRRHPWRQEAGLAQVDGVGRGAPEIPADSMESGLCRTLNPPHRLAGRIRDPDEDPGAALDGFGAKRLEPRKRRVLRRIAESPFRRLPAFARGRATIRISRTTMRASR